MKTGRLTVLMVAFLFVGTMAFPAMALSMNASAASIAGTWVSREAGRGYTQTYIGPYGDLVTEYFDIELTLSGSGSDYSGTLIATGYGDTQSYLVDGTFDGTTFLMTAYYGWDGVNYLTPVYTLVVTGDEMYGSSSYVNVGVTIHGTFDLKKEGLFGVGGLAPIASSVAITISIIAIVIAATPPKARPAPKGFQPNATRVPPPPSRYEPSQQWTTEMPPQPMSGDGTVPVGGVGLHTGATRPMTEAETRAAKAIPKPHRNNAIGMSVVAMVMAVMVNFIEDEIALLMPLFFCFVALGLAIQARRNSGVVAESLVKGTVADLRGTPEWRKGRGWGFGALSIPRGSELDKRLSDGVPASVTVLPDAKHVLSADGVPLKKPVPFVASPGFESMFASQAAAPAQAMATADDDLPPPPEDAGPSVCPQCGKGVPAAAKFCDMCGHRLGP